MAATSAPVYAGLPASLDIGYRTEQYARTRTLDVTAMLSELPDAARAGASVALLFLRPKDTEAYPVTTDLNRTTGALTWTVSPEDTEVSGKGSCQVMVSYSSDPASILLSQIIPVTVNASIVDGDEGAPAPYTAWMAGVAERLAEIEALAQYTCSVTESGTALVITSA